MKYIHGALREQLAGKLCRSRHAFLLMDYDGTLAPIMSKPGQARLHASTRRLLEKLSRNPRYTVGVVSGRAIGQLKSLVGLKDIIYGGNHGLQLEGPGFKYEHARAKRFRRILEKVSQSLKPLEKAFPGSFLEDKVMTLSYHYRLLARGNTGVLRSAFISRVAPWVKRKLVRVTLAKKAFEVRPNLNWNKGSAVAWILLHENPESFPVYVGDDKTDEHIFQVLRERGITVRVGYLKASQARYFVKDVKEVEELLRFFLACATQNGKRAPARREAA